MDEYPPPWIALPDLMPTDPATQGVAEAYLNLSWLPFWRTLTADEKAEYLDRWEASAEWRHAIATSFDWNPVEMEEDARESAEWLAARGPFPPHRPWWKFWA